MSRSPSADPSERRGADVLVVVAGSAGALSVLRAIVRALPHDLAAAVVIVQHRGRDASECLVEILRRAATLRVVGAREGALLERGTIFVAPSDRHVTVWSNKTLHLHDGRRIRHVLSSANPLFDTAAPVFRERLLAIVLTGYDHDGTDGVQAVAAAGGTVLVQDPATSFAPEMPRAALATGAVSAAVPASEIADAVVRFVARAGPEIP